MSGPQYDAVVVGAGPNGLAAAIELARAGRSALLVEAEEAIGGAARSAALTLPGFVHDIGAAIMPFAVASPFLSRLPLGDFGLDWVRPPAAVAHPFDDGTAALLEPSIPGTARSLGSDGDHYTALIEPLLADWHKLVPLVLGPIRPPRYPIAAARFGALAVWPATAPARLAFRGEAARGLLAGLAAHSVLPLDRPLTSGVALLFAMAAHTAGWPLPRGGAGALTTALGRYFESLGGTIVTGSRIRSLRELPPARAVLLDLTPRQVLELAGNELPPSYRRRLSGYRYGPGVFKVDYALARPIPWSSADVARAGTVHLGGTFPEIALAEQSVARGVHPDRPFVLLAQPSLFDDTRAPSGKHTAWAYCHVPNGSTVDMADRIEAQIERFAPGFRELVLARTASFPADLERLDANLIGGDITGGVMDLRQWLGRPVVSRSPYRLAARGAYICSASTPPGGGVHGMCGYHAARRVLADSDERP